MKRTIIALLIIIDLGCSSELLGSNFRHLKNFSKITEQKASPSWTPQHTTFKSKLYRLNDLYQHDKSDHSQKVFYTLDTENIQKINKTIDGLKAQALFMHDAKYDMFATTRFHETLYSLACQMQIKKLEEKGDGEKKRVKNWKSILKNINPYSSC